MANVLDSARAVGCCITENGKSADGEGVSEPLHPGAPAAQGSRATANKIIFLELLEF